MAPEPQTIKPPWPVAVQHIGLRKPSGRQRTLANPTPTAHQRQWALVVVLPVVSKPLHHAKSY